MIKYTLTLRGLLNYDEDLFAGATFPEGIDKDRVIDAILWDGGDFELLYSNPDYIKQHLPHFCASHFYKWERLYNTLNLEYNPIENYDRMETWTDEGEAGTSGTQTNDLLAVNSAAPFNETELLPRESNTDTGTVGTVGESSFSNEHTGRTHGNIGVTTTQEMIAQERRVAEFNLYRLIAGDFIEEFCVQVFG